MMNGAPEMPEVAVTEAIIQVAAGALLVDVREQDEWDAGHAPTAQFLPLSALTERLDELPRDREVLVICQLGGRSARATALLNAEGFTAVNVLGGMQAWGAAAGPVTSAT